MSFYHKSVLLQQVIEMLQVQKGESYIDATLGGGGHTKAILGKGGKVLGIDQDTDALSYVQKELQAEIKSKDLTIVQGNFSNIGTLAQTSGFKNVSGVLFDLGVSSYQLDEHMRGFSIRQNGPLDMRMDAGIKLTAYDIISGYSHDELVDIFQRYGEEDKAEIIVAAIVEARKTQDIKTTHDLVKVIESVAKRQGDLHPATKVFQALRIEVNQELAAIKQGITGALEVTQTKGRIVVISFHSLEDRIVKRMFDEAQQKGLGTIVTKKPIIATTDEVRSNPRARSSKLRVFEKN